jgi:glutathione synthase/RimK-type ligase-like ATP-grasp enzyme
MRSILLVTEEFDPNADNLIQELLHRGIPYLRWNLDRYPQDSSLTYRSSATGFEGAIETDGRVVSFDDIGSVWYRTYRASGFPAGLSASQREFAQQEAEMAVEALPLVTKWQWINDPRYQRHAIRKPAQLFTAHRLGFAVPQTIISNDPGKIRAFCDQDGMEIIYKALSQSANLEPGKAIFTGALTPQALASLDLIRHTPGIFQELIPKAFELRLTVVADKIFAVKILSQEKERTKIDWRLAPYELRYEPTDLPQDIRYLVAAFMTEFNLVYSCLDFIVTPEGKYVFLESNPGGQYLWIEHLTGLPITETIVDALLWTNSSK